MTTGDMTGSLTPSATKCFIFPGASDCVVQLGWSVINPTTVNASYVKVGKNTIATTDMMSNMSAIMPYGLNTVTLYNTGISLDTTTIEAACVVSSVWDPVGGTCKSSVGPTVGLESPSGSSISGSIKIKGYAVPTPTSAIKKIELWTASTPTLVASSDPTSPKYIATFSGVARSDLTQFASNPAFPNIGFLYPSFNTALLGDGAHTITIKAYDLAGNVTTVNTSVAVNNSTNVCGAANNTLTDTMPSTGLCNTGTPSVVSGGTVHPWRWTCTTGSVVKRCGAPYRDANYCNEYLDFGQTAIVNIFSNGFFTPYNWTHVGLQPLLTNPTGSLSNNGSVSLTYGQQPGQTGISFWGSAPPASLAALGATSGTTFPAPVCTVTVDGPDLTASDPTPVSFLAGTPITFTSIVSNMGTVGTVDSFTNVFQLANDSSGSGATIISSSIMTALSPQGEDGSFQTTTSDPHTFTSPGTYYVRACADENASMSGSIVESNENNNCSAWIAVTVTGFDTDLIVTDTGHTPCIVGGPTLFSGTIKNIGTHTSYGSYATNILLISTQPDDHHVTRMVTSPLRNIDPGASAQANFSFNFWASGTYYFSVCADVSYFQYDTSANQSYYLGSNIPETNETNNCSTWSSINVLYATGTMSVNAGFDQYVTLPQTSTTFYGYALDLLHAVSNYSGSYNYSGQEPAVTWTKISGPSGGTIVSPNYLFTGVTNLTIPGVYTYRLTAVENDYFKTIVTSVCSDPEDDSTCSLTTLPNPNYDPTLYSDDMTITVSPATPLVPPSVTFSAVPTTLYQTKNSASLSWSAPDATSCVGASSPLTYANKAGATITINSPFNVTLPRVTGSMSVNPPVTTDYTVTCTGKGGVTSKTVKVKTVFVNVGEN